MQTARPLTGLRVLELGAYISGPYAGGVLASLGADLTSEVDGVCLAREFGQDFL